MKYFITFLWSFCIAQVTFFLGAKLTSMSYSFTHATLLGLAVTLSVIVITKILPPIKKDTSSN